MRIRALALVIVALASAALAQQAAPQPAPQPPGAQPAAELPSLRNTATVPESNEAMLLASQVEQAISNGEFRLALGLIEKMFSMSDELVMTPGGRTLYPVWDQARRMYAQLPPPAVALYRQLNDAEVAARFDAARAAGNLEELETLFRHGRVSSSWPAIGEELAIENVERGRFIDAIEAIRALAEAGVEVSDQVQLLLAVALERAGAPAAAQRALQKIDAAHALPELKDRLSRVRQWLEKNPQQVAGAAAAALAAAVAQQAVAAIWSSELEAPGAGAVEDEDKIADAIESQGRLPLYGAAVADETLIVRMRGALWAFDLPTLAPRWMVNEITGPDEQANIREEAEAGRPMSRDVRLLLTHALRHAVSSANGLIFTIEGSRLAAQAEPERMWGMRSGTPVQPNELMARDLRSGEIVWRSGANAEDSFRAAAFQDAPLIIDGTLCVPVQRADSLALCRIEARTGKLLNEVSIIGPPTKFPYVGGRCRLAADETTIYVSTGNGVVAAVNRDDLHWKWAALYASTISHVTPAPWMMNGPQPPPPHEYGPEPIVLADELVLVAPPDSEGILSLDRISGRQAWPALERQNLEHLIGVLPQGVVVGTNQLTCIDMRDGQTVHWRSVPLQLTGRPAISGSMVFAPTSDGILVIDGRTGKLLRDGRRVSAAQFAFSQPAGAPTDEDAGGAASAEIPTANLVLVDDGLLAVTPSRVVKLAVPELTRKIAQEIISSAGAGDARGATALAWAALLEGHPEEALQILERLESISEAAARARDEVMTHALVALAGGATDEPARITWLKQAASLSTSPRVRAQVNVLMGQALERNQRWSEALAHYAAMVGEEAGQTLVESGDPGTRIAGWLHALQRVQLISKHLSADEIAAQATHLAGPARTSDLQRLLHVMPDNRPFQQELRRKLALLDTPYELLVSELPEDDPALEDWLRRRLHLERWMTHVALGQLAASTTDRQQWESTYAKMSAPPAEGTEEKSAAERDRAATETDLLRRIRDGMAKIERDNLPAFGEKLEFRWRQDRYEFILDPLNPIGAQRAFVLARDSGPKGNFVRLLSAIAGKSWRQTKDSMSAARTNPRTPMRERGFDFEQVPERPRRPSWTAAVWQYLAAVPVEGGLIGIGLGPNGPDRRAGTRLWEHAIPEWAKIETVPREALCAGPLGAYVLRPDGVLMLLGWPDGSIWWECNAKGFDLEHMEIIGERLVAVSRDARALIIDAMRGKVLAELPTGLGSARGALIAGGRIVFWTDESVTGVDPQKGNSVWTTRTPMLERATPLPNVGAIAVRAAKTDEWSILDASSGRFLVRNVLMGAASIIGAVRSGDALIVCNQSSEGGPIQFTAYDAEGKQRWQTATAIDEVPNLTQLAANPRFIPLLSLTPGAGDEQGPDLRLQLVDKTDGSLLPSESLSKHFTDAEPQNTEPMLLATPERLMVQWKGKMIGLGSEPIHP